MGRRKVEVDVSSLGQRTKSMNLIIGSNTTASNVITKVLGNLLVQQPPTKYQLVAIGDKSRVLQGMDYPSHVIQQSAHPIHFKLCPTTPPSTMSPTSPSRSRLIRVYHELKHGVQTYQSTIINPTTKAKEVQEKALSSMAPMEASENYALVLVASDRDVELRPDECPYAFGDSSSNFKLVKRRAENSASLHSKGNSHHSSLPKPYPSSSSCSGSSSHNGGPHAYLSSVELLTGKLRLHGELIDALREVAAQLNSDDPLDSSEGKSREAILEQALVEQSQILDMMQELVSTLESENKHGRDMISKQSKAISGWEKKLKDKDKEMEALRSRSPSSKDDSRTAGLKRQLHEKELAVTSLSSKFKVESESLSAARLTSIKTKLEIERVRCIEYEEEKLQLKSKIAKMSREAADRESVAIHKESELMHLKHEMESLLKFQKQQQDLIMQQRDNLENKNVQVRSLTRAIHKEKKVADQLRRIRIASAAGSSRSPTVVNKADIRGISAKDHHISLFDQVAGRTMYSTELTRIVPETELGFIFSKVDLPPISGQVPCLVVKAVKEGSLAAGKLKVGDEIIEVNGIVCRSSQQSLATAQLEIGVGTLKIIVARMDDFCLNSKALSHSTPMKKFEHHMNGLSNGETDTTWATALNGHNTTFTNFSVETSIISESHNEEAKFVTIPEMYSTPNTSSSEQVIDVPVPVSGDIGGGREEPSTATSMTSFYEMESLISVNSKGDISLKKLQLEITDLQDQLDDSEKIRLEFESSLSSSQLELDHIRGNYEALKSENEELRQQLLASEEKSNDVHKNISELQSALISLQSRVLNDHLKMESLENQNRVISRELANAKSALSHSLKTKDNLEKLVSDLKTDLIGREKREKELEITLQESVLESSRLASDTTHVENELERLRASLVDNKEESEATIATLKQECQHLQSQLNVLTEVSEKTKLSSEEQYEHLNTQLKSAKTLLMEAEMKDSQKQVEMRYLKQAADQANTQLEKLEAEYWKTTDELKYYRQEAEQRTLEMESMTAGLKSTQMRLEAKLEVTSRLQTEIDNLRRTHASHKTEVTQLRELIKEKERRFVSLKNEEEELREKFQESIVEKNEMFEQLEKSYEESTELSAEVEKLTAELKEFEDSSLNNATDDLVNSLRMSVAALQGELESSKKRTEMLAQQSSRVKNELATFQGQCETLANELKQERSEKDQMTGTVDDLSRQLTELQDKKSMLQEELDSKKQEVSDTKLLLVQLQDQVKVEKEHSATHQSRISELESELEMVKSEKNKAEDMATSLEFMQRQNQESLEQMKERYQAKMADARRMSEQIDDLNSRLQKSNLERTSLTASVANTNQQLKEMQRMHTEETTSLKKELTLKEKKVMLASDELESLQSKCRMLTEKVKKLTESMGELNTEKSSLERALEDRSKENTELQSHSHELQGNVSHLKAELEAMTISSDSLSSESAGLRKKLRQSEQEADQLAAKLLKEEMDLEVLKRTLQESELVGDTQEKELVFLENQYRESQAKLDNVKAELENSSLELCRREEELSKLNASLELCQQESVHLQDSMVTMKTRSDSTLKKIEDMEAEKAELLSCVAELQNELEVEKELIEACKKDAVVQKEAVIYRCQMSLEALQHKEKEYINEIDVLKRSNKELEISKEDLIHAQEDIKSSISKLGNEKDAELVELKDKVRSLSLEIDSAKQTERSLVDSETASKERLLEMEQSVAELQKQLENQKHLNEELNEVQQTTERETRELGEKVSLLQEGLREKGQHHEETLESVESELRKIQSENQSFLEKISELSPLKLKVAEQVDVVMDLEKKLAEKEAIHDQILKEKDHLLSIVRDSQVHKHASAKSAQSVTSSVAGAVPTGNNDTKGREELLLQNQQLKEENSRLSDYTDQLLEKIILKAPHLLEK